MKEQASIPYFKLMLSSIMHDEMNGGVKVRSYDLRKTLCFGILMSLQVK